MQQVISIHVGQCGIQIGSALWELLSFEHSVSTDGSVDVDQISPNESIESFFHNCREGHFVPRAVLIDLEPNVLDEIRTGSYRKFFHPDQLIHGTDDAANNFARGFYTSGRLIRSACKFRLRKEIEMSDRLFAIHIYRSLGGGTGSGMSATIFEILCDFSKITKMEIPIHPSPHLSSAIVEPYNCILTEHYCMDDIDISILMDNEALYDVLSEEVSINRPTLSNLNRIIAQICSSMTCSSRFSNSLYNDFTIMTNLVPYPRIHYPLVSYAPFGNASKLEKDKISVHELTRAVFRSSNQLVKCDPSNGKYMSCSLIYRGSISPPEVYDILSEIKSSNEVHFVDWCPTGFKVGIVNQAPHILPDSHVGSSPKNLIMMTNNSAVSTVWHRLSQKFHKLYSKRSFVHWFIAEGLEESEFCESLFNIATLAKDYEEVSLDTPLSNESKDMGVESSTKSPTVTDIPQNNLRLSNEKIALDNFKSDMEISQAKRISQTNLKEIQEIEDKEVENLINEHIKEIDQMEMIENKQLEDIINIENDIEEGENLYMEDTQTTEISETTYTETEERLLNNEIEVIEGIISPNIDNSEKAVDEIVEDNNTKEIYDEETQNQETENDGININLENLDMEEEQDFMEQEPKEDIGNEDDNEDFNEEDNKDDNEDDDKEDNEDDNKEDNEDDNKEDNDDDNNDDIEDDNKEDNEEDNEDDYYVENNENNMGNIYGNISKNVSKNSKVSRLKAKNDVKSLIRALSTSFTDKRMISKNNEFDLFLEKFSSKPTFQWSNRKSSVPNKSSSDTFSKTKSKTKRKICSSIKPFETIKEEEKTHSLMEELIRITAEISI